MEAGPCSVIVGRGCHAYRGPDRGGL